MSEHIWVSMALPNYTGGELGFGWPKKDYDIAKRIELGDALMIDVRRGNPLPAHRFPNRLETEADMENLSGTGHGKILPKLLPDCVRWTCPVISKKVVDVLSSFDMGQSNWYPVEMFRHDKQLTYPQEFFCLSIGNVKETVSVEKSDCLKPMVGSKPSYSLRVIGDDDLVVSENALSGPDIWVDPILRGLPFFVSDRLNAALTKAGLAEALALKRCVFA